MALHPAWAAHARLRLARDPHMADSALIALGLSRQVEVAGVVGHQLFRDAQSLADQSVRYGGIELDQSSD